MRYIAFMAVVMILGLVPSAVSGSETSGAGPAAETDKRLIAAQLRVLRLRCQVSDDDENGPSADEVAAEFVADGMPASAFTEDAMKAAAVNQAVEKMRRTSPRARPRIVAEARNRYGVTLRQLGSELPSSEVDVSDLFERYLERRGSADAEEALRRLKEAWLSPEEIEVVAAKMDADGTERAFIAGLSILERDWSDAGLDYVYRQLQQSDDSRRQLALLDALKARAQIRAETHSTVCEKLHGEKLLARAFEVAERALTYDDPKAIQFLEAQLRSPHATNRQLSVKMLVGNPTTSRGKSLVSLLDVIRAETDVSARAAMVRHLRRVSMREPVEQLLYSILGKDAATEVRLAVLETVYLPPTNVPQERRDLVDGRISELEKAVAMNPQPEVQAALAAKLENYERECEELARMRDEHRKRLDKVREKLQIAE